MRLSSISTSIDRRPLYLAISLSLLVAANTFASERLSLTRPTVGSGGGRAAGPILSLGHSVGQPAGGKSASTSLEIEFGFWAGRRGAVTAVDGAPGLPAVFRLHPNAPNPFNPRTEIRFDLPDAVPTMSIEVFDIAGRRVATLARAAYPAGSHAVIWNGTDDDGRPVVSGIYLYRLDSSVFRQTRKLTLVR